MKLRDLAFAATLLVGSGTAAAAEEITFNVLDAQWINAVGGNVTLLDPDTGTDPMAFGDPAFIRWGDGGTNPLGTDSGYDFDARDPVPFTEPGRTPFVLGDFTHQNFPISSGTAINSVTLGILADVFCGICQQDFLGVTFKFEFLHDETPNTASPCAYNPNELVDTLIVGDNSNGCGDFVQIVGSPENPIIGGSTLQILGFTDNPDDPETFFSNFFSGEGNRNPATLIAQFAPPGVPSVAPLALLGLGLAGMAAAVRRKGRDSK